jgi:hypothetical protein
MLHECRASHCRVKVPREYLMCPRHWRLVPREIAALVSKHWRTGSTREWKKAVSRAIYAVGVAEGIYRQVTRAVYLRIARSQLEIDIPDLLDVLGLEDTEANRDAAVSSALEVARELHPDVPQFVQSEARGVERVR